MSEINSINNITKINEESSKSDLTNYEYLIHSIEEACRSLSKSQRETLNKINTDNNKNKEDYIDLLKKINIRHQQQIKRLQKFILKSITRIKPVISDKFSNSLGKSEETSIDLIGKLIQDNIGFDQSINEETRKALNKLYTLLASKYAELKIQTIEYVQISSKVCQDINSNEIISLNNSWIEETKLFFKAFNDNNSATQLSEIIRKNIDFEITDEQRIIREALNKKKLAEELQEILEALETELRQLIKRGIQERDRFLRLSSQRDADNVFKEKALLKANELKKEIVIQSEEKSRIKAQIKYTTQTLQYVSYDLNNLYNKLIHMDEKNQENNKHLINEIRNMCFSKDTEKDNIYDVA